MRLLLAAFILCNASCGGSIAAEPVWKAGVASIKITPDKPIPLAGYAARVKPFERVEHDLYAKALALEDQAGNRAVLVTTDLIGLSKQIVEPIWDRLEPLTKLSRQHILFSASHTHSGPMLRRSDLPIPGIAEADAKNLAAYTRDLQDKLVALVVDSLTRLEPAELSWATGAAHFAMNRREFTDRGIILGVNPRGLVDRTVPVLRVSGPSGQVRAVLFGYACHNTTLTQTNYAVSGDYAGVAQLRVQERYRGAQAMFMAGCAGDANPYPRGTMDLAQQHGTALGDEVCRVLSSDLKPVRGPLRCLMETVELPLQNLSRSELEQMVQRGVSWQAPSAKQMLTELDQGKPLNQVYRSPVAVWQFGRDLTLVGLPGEVVVDYVPLIEQAVGPLRLWIAAYCNDVFGYLPSARVVKEGGYEARGLYTDLGWFTPDAQDVLVSKIRDLAERAGREKLTTGQ